MDWVVGTFRPFGTILFINSKRQDRIYKLRCKFIPYAALNVP